jgi:periplasmic protein TonB
MKVKRTEQCLAIAMLALAVMAYAQQPGDRPPQKIRVSWEVFKERIQQTVEPQLPLGADGKPRHGDVVLRITVGRRGNVVAARLDGQPDLADSAIAAVKQWTFRPFLLNGESIEMESDVKLILKPGHAVKMASPH